MNLLVDTPLVPGDTRPAFEHGHQARQVLNDAEEDLRDWTPNLEPVPSHATGMGVNLMPSQAATTATSISGQEDYSSGSPVASRNAAAEKGLLEYSDRRDISGSSTVAQPEPTSGYQQ